MKLIYVSSVLLLCCSCSSKKNAVELDIPPPAMHVHTVYPGALPPVYNNTGIITPDNSIVPEYTFSSYTPEEKVLYKGH